MTDTWRSSARRTGSRSNCCRRANTRLRPNPGPPCPTRANGDGEIVDVIYLQAEQTKGNEGRRVFVGKRAKAALKRYLQSDINVIQRTFLFNTQKSKHFNTNALTQLLKRLYENAHIKGASSHSTRRTFITNLANKGVNVRVIAELASHKSIQTTQRYIDTNDTMLSNAVDLV